MKLGAELKPVDGAPDWAPKENGEAVDDAPAGAAGAPNPDGGKEPNGVVACDPNVGIDDFEVISPNAGVDTAGPAAPKVNGADVVLVALAAPNDPKVGAAAVG